MIIRSMKKVLSSVIITAFVFVYAAPMGLCVTSLPPLQKMKAEVVTKPALRTGSKPSELKLEGALSISKTNQKISLSLRDSDVKQVLRMFADKAGLNIIFHDSVTGKVTLDLVNLPLNEAFKLVLQVTNLTYFVDNNTMVVTSAAAAQTLNLAKQEMMTIPVKYVNAGTLADFLNKNIFSINKPGLSNSQIAVTNPGTNEILIFGTKNDYLMAKKVIAQFDIKPREHTFVVNHTTPKEMSTLICSVLMKQNSSTGSGSGTSGGSSSSSPGAASGSGQNQGGSTSAPSNSPSQSNPPNQSNNNKTSWFNKGTITGAATSSSGSSGSSSSSSSSGSSSSSSSGLSLGEGIVACQNQGAINAGGLSSLNTTSLSVTYFPQRGVIQVLGGSLQQMEMIKDFIALNDKKQPQAYLEVSILELNEDGSREFSNTWNVWSSFFSGGFDGTSVSTNSMYPNFVTGDSYQVYKAATDSAGPSKIYDVGRFSGSPVITYNMNYLISNSKGRVLANPRIMITNGQESSIDLSSDYVKTVKSEVLSSSSGVASGIQRTYEIGSDDGIKVTLTPFISPEGYVTLNIKPEYSTIKDQVKVPMVVNGTVYQDLMATLLERRNLDLKNIRIKDGETLVLGGMMREEETKSVAKIPVLGDLPGVGMFFRNTSSTKTKNELVIMITPKIIKDSEDLVNGSGATL